MKLLSAALLLATVSTAQATETWVVQLGTGSAVQQGTWQINVQGDTVSGGGMLAAAGKAPETFGLAGRVSAKTYQLARLGGATAGSCVYNGTASSDGTTISGAYSCAGKVMPWFASVRK